MALLLAASAPAPARAHGPGDPCLGECGICATTSCGDGKCEVSAGETCVVCPDDCGACSAARCGDGRCDVNAEEWCYTCPDDCGLCPETRICNGLCEPEIGEACAPGPQPDAGAVDATPDVSVEQACADGQDNDGDGDTDCDDSDCVSSPSCGDAGLTSGVGPQASDGCAVGGRGAPASVIVLLALLLIGRLRSRSSPCGSRSGAAAR
ncbi:MAG: hypothetical protein KC503_40470 [Myxococcales bacterium]|nr:hypothetical protein [Myxococcales bacterium]